MGCFGALTFVNQVTTERALCRRQAWSVSRRPCALIMPFGRTRRCCHAFSLHKTHVSMFWPLKSGIECLLSENRQNVYGRPLPIASGSIGPRSAARFAS